MKKIIYTFTALLIVIIAFPSVATGQDLVYQPRNPAFGGDTFNYQWMLSSAQSQDKLKDPKESSNSLYERDPLKDFKDSLNRQILNQLSRQLVSSQFGEDALTPGKYTIGDYDIDISEGMTGININILDKGTGNRTSVTIPYY